MFNSFWVRFVFKLEFPFKKALEILTKILSRPESMCGTCIWKHICLEVDVCEAAPVSECLRAQW